MSAQPNANNGASATNKAKEPSAEDKAIFLAEAASWIQASQPQRISKAVKRGTLKGLERLRATKER